MTGGDLPQVELPQLVDNGDESKAEPVLDLTPSSKLGFAWQKEATLLPDHGVHFSSSEGDTTESDADLLSPPDLLSIKDLSNESTSTPPQKSPAASVQPSFAPSHSRASTMPLPPQLLLLPNPGKKKSSPRDASSSSVTDEDPTWSPFDEASLELADSVQTVVQTLLQVSPPQMMNTVREQFSACSLCIPTPSVSAMLTSLKNLKYISAHMASLYSDRVETHLGQSESQETPRPPLPPNDFDVGETLQSVGDVLSGAAAQCGVDLVLFHGDAGIKHMTVRGDEGGISFALSHITRQVLHTARRGDTLEIGVHLDVSSPRPHSPIEAPSNLSDPPLESSFSEATGPLRCTFVITHTFVSSRRLPDGSPEPESSARPRPTLTGLMLRRLLRHIGASLVSDLELRGLSIRRSCELTIVLERALPQEPKPPKGEISDPSYKAEPTDDPVLFNEPSLEELTQFAETMRGRKFTLYASTKGMFAHHLTSYLTAWGLDVTHVSLETGQEVEALSSSDYPESRSISMASMPGASPAKSPVVRPLSFVLVDDDLAVLRDRLEEFRSDQPFQRNPYTRQRPTLSVQQRPTSTPRSTHLLSQLRRLSGPDSSVFFIHFACLSNYKAVKDLIQSVVASSPPDSVPEVMLIPKPAGPRRFLTALHTAVTRPVVDPFFVPNATSPYTPPLYIDSPFYPSGDSKSFARWSPGSRSSSEHLARSPKESALDLPSNFPSSQGSIAERKEYFAENKLGPSPSSGLVVQSPDGQPAGILFHPKARSSRSSSSNREAEREKSQVLLRAPTISRRPSEKRASEVETQIPPTPLSYPLRAFPFAGQPSALRTPSEEVPRGGSRTSVLNMPKTTPPREGKASVLEPGVAPTHKMSTADANVQKSGASKASVVADALEASEIPCRPPLRKSPQDGKKGSTPPGARKGKSPGNANVVPPISILIVDDNPINRTLLSTWMKKRQIKYDVAMNGLEAVQKWKTGGFHLILMDIQMPVMDGIEATKEIRRLEKLNAAAGYPPSTPSEEGTPKTPSDSPSDARVSTSPFRSSVIIVALTASSLQSDRVAALAAGCNDFLTKPVSLVWLNSKIMEWGSIKALQMWADLRPDVVKSISSEQVAQARNVAQRLHVPEGKSPSRSRSNSTGRPLPTPSFISGPVVPRLTSFSKRVNTRTPARDESGSPPSTANSQSERDPSPQTRPQASSKLDTAAPPEVAGLSPSVSGETNVHDRSTSKSESLSRPEPSPSDHLPSSGTQPQGDALPT